MTQHGTSVVIKQTNDGLGPAELRLLEMLQVVAGDQKEPRKRNDLHPSILGKRLRWSGFVGLELIPACTGPPDEDKHKKTCIQEHFFQLT